MSINWIQIVCIYHTAGIIDKVFNLMTWSLFNISVIRQILRSSLIVISSIDNITTNFIKLKILQLQFFNKCKHCHNICLTIFITWYNKMAACGNKNDKWKLVPNIVDNYDFVLYTWQISSLAWSCWLQAGWFYSDLAICYCEWFSPEQLAGS